MSWIGDFLRNLTTGELTLSRRLRQVANNYRRRIVLRQACCGNPGEPGC